MSSIVAKVINVGIISFGLSGRIFHAPFALTNPKFNLVAVYERTKSESQEFAAKNGITVDVVRSLEELVNRPDIDLIVVSSPIEFHYEHARQALAAGKHVLVEKAFTSTSQQARELLSFAAEKGLVCVPYQNRRYDSDFLTLRRVLPQLGNISEYNGIYNRWDPKVNVGYWQDTIAGSGGMLYAVGTHMIDQAVVLFGTPARVYGDVRAQRVNSVIDDTWEVHLYYNNARSGGPADATGLHTGGFRAILKGSSLTRDHALRYAVHGEAGSWTKTGMDTQEPELVTGVLPTYPPISPLGDLPTVAEASVYPYGAEPVNQWGVLTTTSVENPATATSVVTPSLQGNYHRIYDEVYAQIVDRAPPSVDDASVVPTVLRIIELARESSRLGRVLDFSFAKTV